MNTFNEKINRFIDIISEQEEVEVVDAFKQRLVSMSEQQRDGLDNDEMVRLLKVTRSSIPSAVKRYQNIFASANTPFNS